MVGTLAPGMPRSPLLLALVATAALAGCAGQASSSKSSSTKFQGDERLVANTIEDLESASQPSKIDQSKICGDLLATALVRQLAARGGTCEKAVKAAVKDADAYQLTVQAVRVQGGRATASVKVETGAKDKIQPIALVKQGQGWRISKLG
jgi:hypothetical protein